MFFKKEIIGVDQPDRTEPMEKVQARCAILTPKEFESSKRFPAPVPNDLRLS